MIKRTFALFALLLGLITVTYAQNGVSFASHPTLSPDGNTIIFSYDGDLWKVATNGGEAYRITAMEGNETSPRISPDGKWIAFSSNENGNTDVYVMPIDGGEIKQLTWHSAADEVYSWSWDSKEIYFTSSRANNFTTYKVNIGGGTPERVFGHYFNTVHNAVEMPSGEILFNTSWESYTMTHRKRYKGEFNPDIRLYNPKTEEYKELTDYEGKDFWASVDKDGKIYFVSDESNGEYNLYTFENEVKTALTNFETSIKRPFVSADGSKVVFEKDYQVFVYDVASQQTTKPNIQLAKNKVIDKNKDFEVAGNISYMDVSPDGKKIAFISRGELFVSDAEGKFVRQMPSTGERTMEVKWLQDNKTILFSQTHNGYPNWFTRSADGSDSPKQHTNDLKSNRDIHFNNDASKGVYLSGRDEVRIIDLNSLKSETIVNDEVWGFQSSAPSFSPDGKYVVYTARRNFEEDIFVYNIDTGDVLNLTNTGVSETDPVWSPDGKYIYFASNRTKPSYPYGMQNASIFRIALEKHDDPYRFEKFDALFSEKDDSDEKADNKKNQKKDDQKKDNVKVVIDLQGIDKRIERVSQSFGTQSRPVVFTERGKTHVLYSSNQDGGRSALYRTTYEDFERPETNKVTDGWVGGIIEVKGTYYTISRGNINKLNIDSGKLNKIDINHSFYKNLEDEFYQMFDETWAGIDENFYDGNFHGADWPKIKDQYESYLPLINSRNDLRILLNDMLGELNSSHMGFNTRGNEENVSHKAVTNEIGVVFDNTNPFKVEEVLKDGPAGKKGVDIQNGDVLVSVNGKSVDSNLDRDFYFTFPRLEDEIQLTFNRNGKEVETRVHPQSNGAFKTLLYNEWIDGNRARVDELSGDRIAYTHMKDMSTGQLESFMLDMMRYENKTDATILDLRYNRGGNVHDAVLQFLSQRPYLQWEYRGGARSPQPNFAPSGKPIVLLINEQSLSDAEMTSAGFKALNLGTIIGTETYRWIIFTSAKSLVDGSSYRVPGWGTYSLDGDDLELTGVSPDIYVKNTFVDRLNGADPQLERAVQEILNQLEN